MAVSRTTMKHNASCWQMGHKNSSFTHTALGPHYTDSRVKQHRFCNNFRYNFVPYVQ